jgi:hypothetical protein
MTLRIFGPLLVAAAALVGAAPPGPSLRSPQADRRSLRLTIYSQGVASVSETRTVALPQGRVDLRIEGVPERIDPQTLSVSELSGAPVEILEQSFQSGPDSLAPLLRRFLGQDVTLVRRDPAGREERISAVPVHAGNTPEETIFEINGRLEVGGKGLRIVFPPSASDELALPGLFLHLSCPRPGPRLLRLAYLTRGLSWSASYALTVSSDEKFGDLDGWSTVENESGTDYDVGSLELVAGSLSLASPQHPRPTLMAAEATVPAERSFSEYHLYTIRRRVVLRDHEQKQLALLSAAGVPISKRYQLSAETSWYRSQAGADRRAVSVIYRFRNEAASHLGMPLPAGRICVYLAEKDGTRLIGEATIGHTPEGEEVTLPIGTAFDIVGETRQTDYKVVGNARESGYAVTIRNHGATPATVRVEAPFGGQWQILESSLPYEKDGAFSVHFDVPVPAKGEKTLTYRVRIQL